MNHWSDQWQVERAPNQADTVTFWRGLWSEPVNHSEGSWTEVVASQCTSITPMNPVIITPGDVAEAVCRASNWKSPGLDRLHHYWLKGFVCWQDWRSDVKSKAAKIRRAQQQTGGGPGPAPSSAMEESLMAFIGHKAAEGLAVADTLEIPEGVAEVEAGGDEDIHNPVVDDRKTTKKQDRLEECLEVQAAAMNTLSQSMNNLAAAINNFAAALKSIANKSDK
ncbi:unnamed protein product [Parnassius apollo]|uniref:(apollo) hypothetical protein n=1 Tax=Parnassius apollo TaxID=110799 RepID=A0A8S3W4B1_PARAO|nr:unnamed protein product [Parnassius apollo]